MALLVPEMRIYIGAHLLWELVSLENLSNCLYCSFLLTAVSLSAVSSNPRSSVVLNSKWKISAILRDREKEGGKERGKEGGRKRDHIHIPFITVYCSIISCC